MPYVDNHKTHGEKTPTKSHVKTNHDNSDETSNHHSNALIEGARQAKPTWWRRILASIMTRDLKAFVVPGVDVARSVGLDLNAAGLQSVVTPRHANVLLIVGHMPPELRAAAAVIYSQMMRPRVLLALGSSDLSPLPKADIESDLSQQQLVESVILLRDVFTRGAFRVNTTNFEADILQVQIKYTCSMHPEIVQDKPGSCPKCGMTLVQKEAQLSNLNKDTKKTIAKEHVSGAFIYSKQAEKTVYYTCPMHPEVHQNQAGNCPKCGMHLVLFDPAKESSSEQTHKHRSEAMEHSKMDHSEMDHSEMAFMSMIDVTKDLPLSGDGLPMEWIEVPFGPFFPGLPSGLMLSLILDGDTVVSSKNQFTNVNKRLVDAKPMPCQEFIDRLAHLDCLSPVAYRQLACKAIENATMTEVSSGDISARIGALERERVVSHLGWLATFAQQIGFDWLEKRATSLQLSFLEANIEQVKNLKPAISRLIKRLHRTPLLSSRIHDIGKTMVDQLTSGPVARAAGINNDARSLDQEYLGLGFKSVLLKAGDTQARLKIRLAEITQSIELIEKVGAINIPHCANIRTKKDHSMIADPESDGKNMEFLKTEIHSVSGEAVVETPRGLSRLKLSLEHNQIVAAELTTPSAQHAILINSLVSQQELGDALVSVGSLDLSPWEICERLN